MASKVLQNLTFDKGKTVKEVYRILNRCMAEEKTVRISRKAMLEKSIAKQKERLGRYIDLCADGVITKQELMERRKGLDAQIAELQSQYYNAPDLEWVGKNGWRFVNAVSDFATHADPIRKTRNYNENLFLRTAEGNPMIDKAYKMVLAAA